jgi:hypothetical protein
MAILIVVVSLVAGLLVFGLTTEFKASEEFNWWAFLRLIDPGYLGDDKGSKRNSQEYQKIMTRPLFYLEAGSLF